MLFLSHTLQNSSLNLFSLLLINFAINFLDHRSLILLEHLLCHLRSLILVKILLYEPIELFQLFVRNLRGFCLHLASWFLCGHSTCQASVGAGAEKLVYVYCCQVVGEIMD